MSYIRKSGIYIYPTGDGIDINGQFISNDNINLLLYAIKNRDNELEERINSGKQLFIGLDRKQNFLIEVMRDLEKRKKQNG